MRNLVFFVIALMLQISIGFSQKYERYKVLLDTTIESKHLGFSKNIRVTVPIEWQADGKQSFPLAIVFDKQNPRSHNYIINTMDYMTSNEQMPSCVIIGVESDQEKRVYETWHKISGKAGLADANEKFVFEELIPLAEKKFHASKYRMIIGHSRYGYFSTSLLQSQTDQINAVISISPFFEQDGIDLVDSMPKLYNKRLAHTIYYRYAIGNDFPEDYKRIDSALQTLNNNNINSKGLLFPKADHNVTPGLTIGTALYEIFEYWYRCQLAYTNENNVNLTNIDSIQTEIKSHYGHDLSLSIGFLNGKGWQFFSNDNYEKAILAWEIMLKNYPNFSEAYLYIATAQQSAKQDYSQSIQDFKISLQKSKMYSEAEKIDLLKELDNFK